MSEQTITNGPTYDGRDPRTGQFVKGWKGGPGHIMHRDVTEMRRTLHQAILSVATPEKIAKILDKLIEKAAEGDVLAAREVLDRVLGKAKVTMEVQQDRPSIEQLRQRVLATLRQDPNALRRLLGPAMPPVIDAGESGVAG